MDLRDILAKEIIEKIYRQGFKDGLTAFAYWSNGEQLVGTGGTTLKMALEVLEDNYTFQIPDRLDLLGDLS